MCRSEELYLNKLFVQFFVGVCIGLVYMHFVSFRSTNLHELSRGRFAQTGLNDLFCVTEATKKTLLSGGGGKARATKKKGLFGGFPLDKT